MDGASGIYNIVSRGTIEKNIVSRETKKRICLKNIM
jgi:hypothetical protein